MKRFDAIVIGAGLAGMSAALLLARRGRRQRVALLERGVRLAPLIAGFDRGGAHFETGIHYSSCLGPGEVGRFFFEQLGVDVPVRPCADGHDEIRLLPTGRVFRMVCGRERLAAALGAEFPAERAGIVRYLELARLAAERSSFLQAHRRGLATRNFFEPSHGAMLQEVLDECFRSPELKAIFSAGTFLHGAPPGRVSFTQHSCVVSGMFDSMWEIVGGGRALAEAYRVALAAAGVEVLLNTEVTGVEMAPDNMKLLRTKDGPPLSAARCVAAIHPREFFKFAPAGVYRAGYLSRAALIPETTGFFSLYAVNASGRPRAGNNVFLLPELDFKKLRPDGDGTPYYVNFSQDPPQPQTANVIVFTDADGELADRRGARYRELKKAEEARHRQRFAELAPDVARDLQFVASATPGTQRKYTGYSGGYGLMHDAGHAGILPVTKLPGVYLAGQSVVAPGLLGSMISAFLVNQIIGAEQS